MNVLYDPFEAVGMDTDLDTEPPSDHAPDEHPSLSSRALHWQLVEHLTCLQAEYKQIRAWLERMQAQLSEREVQLRQRLDDAFALLCQLDGRQESDLAAPGADEATGGTVLKVQAFGQFTVRYRGQMVSLGSNKNGRAIFRYLATHSKQRAPKDVLLALFWPDDPPHSAAHKLHIAISALRCALTEALGSVEVILFVDDQYRLAPDLHIELDAELFTAHVQAGERLEREGRVQDAIDEYNAARALYRGDLLAQDLYADWAIAQRARFEEMLLTLLGRLARHYVDQGRHMDCIDCCRQILARDSFREDAYRQLMCCYSRMGRRNQALREYQRCQEVLRRELGVDPMQETVALHECILREEPV
jgi:DNA-binding SARP family transcriptional activator